MRRGAAALAVLTVWLLPEVSSSQTPIRVGGEFQVNTYTTGTQGDGVPAPATDGNFLIVWNDNRRAGLFGRLYDRLGAPLGSEWLVNAYTTGSHGRVAIAPDAAGNMAIAWSRQTEESEADIFVRRFDAAGSPQDPVEFRVNSYTLGTQYAVAAAADATGNLVLVWASSGQDGNGFGIFGRRLDSSGAPAGSEFRVNSYTTGDQRRPAVAFDDAGSFIVVWDTPDRNLGGPTSVVAQRYDASGLQQGGEFRVTGSGAGEQPSVASIGGGRFVVVWDGEDAGDSQDGIFGRRVDASGTPSGLPFLVNSHTTGSQNRSRVAADHAGNFTVVWGGEGEDASNWGVFGQRYDALGNREGTQFQANTFTTGFQTSPFVASQPGGDFVVTWGSPQQDGDASGVFAQRFAPDVIFNNGFEVPN